MARQDFMLSQNGDIEIIDNNIAMIEERDIFVQCFRQLLQTRKGEYFLNTDEGLDFSVFLGVKNIDYELATDALHSCALQVEDFVEFQVLEYNFDDQTRKLNIKMQALFADGYRQTFLEEVEIGG